MALISYKRPDSDEQHLRSAHGMANVFAVSMALLERGDELVGISPNRDEYPIEVAQVLSAKANRDEFLAHGIPCMALPVLTD